jgi:hypothetical protein
MFKWIIGIVAVAGVVAALSVSSITEATECYTLQQLSTESVNNNASVPAELTSVETTLFEAAFLENYGKPLPDYDTMYHTEIGLITYVFVFNDGCAIGMVNLSKVVYDGIVGVI